jgi:hypothetical protein
MQCNGIGLQNDQYSRRENEYPANPAMTGCKRRKFQAGNGAV